MQFLKNGFKDLTHSSKCPMGIAIDPPEGLRPQRVTICSPLQKNGRYTSHSPDIGWDLKCVVCVDRPRIREFNV